MDDKNKRKMTERYGEYFADHISASIDKEKQAETDRERKKYEAKQSEDKAMRERWGDKTVDAIDKATKDGKARFNALYSEYGNKSKYGSYFNDSDNKQGYSEVGNTIKDIITGDRADKAYAKIYEEYSNKLNRLYNLLEVDISLHRNELESINPDMAKIALLIIWQTIKARYPEYFNDK